MRTEILARGNIASLPKVSEVDSRNKTSLVQIRQLSKKNPIVLPLLNWTIQMMGSYETFKQFRKDLIYIVQEIKKTDD